MGVKVKLAATKSFLDDNFLLGTREAEILYHDYASVMPIIDYHNHLPPQQIADNTSFENITQLWLAGDHYKWRAMRARGVQERYCTGDASDREKFSKWTETVPYTMRNPLYHWTHMELQRYFGIDELLNDQTGPGIYNQCNEALLDPEYSVRGLLTRMNVKVLCTTDDPLDSLEYHQMIDANPFGIKVFPAFRPDKFILIGNPAFVGYVEKLGALLNREILSYSDLIAALETRMDYFGSLGCRISDHGLEQIYADPYTVTDLQKAFSKVMVGEAVNEEECKKYMSGMLIELGKLYHKKGWKQQFHLGALRNQNVRALRELGVDTGWDSIGDFPQAVALGRFLGKLDEHNQLAPTIIYNLNPADNEVFATMIGNFNDGSVAGKVQWGSSWWFLDQKDGMEKQINTLSNMGLISQFIGMLTDSRSFMSFPRHEYFRRILCNLFGKDIQNGELPSDLEWIGGMIQDICYNNAARYFDFD